MMSLTIWWVSILLAWLAMGWLLAFAGRFGVGKREHPNFDRELLGRYVLALLLIGWPLATMTSWHWWKMLPVLIAVIGLLMIGFGIRSERLGKRDQVPNDKAGRMIGQGGLAAIIGLLLGFALLNTAALIPGAAI